MKIVITGANSFIGIHLVQRMEELGWETISIVRPGRFVAGIKNSRVVALPMESYHLLGTLVGACDCFVHLSWNGTRGESRMNAVQQQENVTNSLRGVISMMEAGCERIISAGSQAEYGPHAEQITEDSPCWPNTEYGKAKLSFYENLSKICEQSHISYKEPRFFSLYGPGDFSGTMISSVLEDMCVGRPCQLTKCVQMWDFLYIDDAVEGLIQLCSKPCQNGVYNFGSGDTRPLRSFIEEMATITQTQSPLCFGEIPYPSTGMVSIWPDVTKLKREINWEPKVSFRDGIESLLKFQTSNNYRGKLV